MALHPLYLYGTPGKIEELKAICEKHGALMIEDTQDKDYHYIMFAEIDNNIMINDFSIIAPTVIGGSKLQESLADKTEIIIKYLNGEENNYKIKEIEEHKLDIDSGKILFINPCDSNQRIIMQQGLFMIPYTLDQKRHREIINNHTSIMAIDRCLRPELLRRLDTMGFNMFRLMPDVACVCKAVMQKVKDERECEPKA